MWSRVFCGVSAEHIIECFVFYSMLGWAVESLYMSICNRKLTNRGFGVGPFCPIYGFGAVFGYFLLRPLASHPVMLYLTAAVTATIFEYLVAILMQKVLHQVWWDYNEKPFNYKGLICLESTLAWGIYGLGIVRVIQPAVLRFLAVMPEPQGRRVAVFILFLYMLDFTYHLLSALEIDIRESAKEKKEYVMERYHTIRDNLRL